MRTAILNLHKFCVPNTSKRSFSSTETSRKVSIVSGASRGIGLGFVTYLLQSTNDTVIAVSRTKSVELENILQNYKDRCAWMQTDLTSEDSVKEATREIGNLYSRVDTLINCAGILGGSNHSPGPERTVLSIQKDWLIKSFETNLFGHIMMTKHVTPLMKRDPNASKSAKIINLSARVGSISDNRLGGWYSYRMSKAALNMFTKTLSIELKRFGIITISIHPGTTDTDLSKPFQKNVAQDKLFSVEYSVQSMMKNVVDKLSLPDTGKFFAYDGSEIEY